MLVLLVSLVFLATLTASGSLAQEPQEERGLYEDVFGRPGPMPIDLAELSRLPIPVQLAVRTAVSPTEITEVGTEIAADGELIYVVDFADPAAAAGRGSIDVTSLGRIVQLEEAIAIEQLPPLAVERMKTWMPNLEVIQVEKSVRPDAVVFEVDGVDAQGNEIYIEMPADGRSLTMEFVAAK
jgi:hypothetical protein